MKILFITNYDTMYGANKSLFAMMTLLKSKHNVEPYLLVSGTGGGEIGKLCAEKNIPVLSHDFRLSVVEETIRHKRIRKLTRRCMRYVDFLKVLHYINQKGIQFDMVHSNSSIFDIGYFLSKVWHVPHVWHIREFAKAGYALETVLGHNSTRKKYMRSDAVIAISNSIYEYILHIDNKIPVKLVYNGVDIPKVYQKSYVQGKTINFCIVGSVNRKKCALDIIKSCVYLQSENITNYKLYIVGNQKGEYYEEILHYLEEHEEIKNNIVFTGYCNDVHSFLKGMDIGIMASEAEAFGRVTVEYMANYMAVIGTNTGGTPELVKFHDDLFSPHDIEQLAKLMKKYIQEPNQLVERGKENRLQAEKFTAERNAEAIYQLYNSILK